MITIKHKKFKLTVPKMRSKLLEITIIMIKKILFAKSVVKFLLTSIPMLHIYSLSFIALSKTYVGVSETLFEVPSSKLCVFQ